MEENTYPFALVSNEFRYEFISVSAKKQVKKLIIISQTNIPTFFNLALLDVLENGELSDISETKNNDFRMVLATVIRIIEDFLAKYPENSIVFRGSDERRQRLYRLILGRELSKITGKFEVFGNVNHQFSLFEANKDYDFFLIRKL